MNMVQMKKLSKVAALVAPAAVLSAAVAGTGGTEFGPIVTQLTDWLEGGLGQVLALAALAVGLGIGVIQQSVLAVVVGIAMAVAVFYGPNVLTNVVSGGLAF
jgi:conjugal transfer pilus assembly protein TraA